MVQVIKSVDVVVCALGAGRNSKKDLPVEVGVKEAIKAMKINKVKKIVVLSAVGSNEMFITHWLQSYALSFFLGHVMEDHRLAEKVLEESDPTEVQWTTIHVK